MKIAVVELVLRVPDDDPVAAEWIPSQCRDDARIEGQIGLPTAVVGRAGYDQVHAPVQRHTCAELGRAIRLFEAEGNRPPVATHLPRQRAALARLRPAGRSR